MSGLSPKAQILPKRLPALAHKHPPAAPNTNRLCPYPLAERDSDLRRDRATRSSVCLRLRSHSIQPGLRNATGAYWRLRCSATCQALNFIAQGDHVRKARSAANPG